jgi:drug/metabolite transporter (DMT)-like permease
MTSMTPNVRVSTVARVPIVLGLLASLLIGGSDFLGARSSGRTTALQTTTAAFLGGAVAALVYSPLLGTPTLRDLLVGALSGVMVAVALTMLWRAYIVSSIGVAAPIAAVVSTVLPVLADTARGEVPGPLGWLGVVVGVVALFLTSWVPGASGTTAGILLGAGSGVFFAAMFLIAVEASDASGTWPIVTQRATAFMLALVVAALIRERPLGPLAPTRWSLVAGVLGASGVAAVVYGGQRYPLTPVVVAGSMYPAVAIALGWMFLHQRLAARQVIGLVGALLGVALIALD